MTVKEKSAMQYLAIYGYWLQKGARLPLNVETDDQPVPIGYEIISAKSGESWKAAEHPDEKNFLTWQEVVDRVTSFVPEAIITLGKEE